MPDAGMKHDGGKAPIARGFARYFPRAIEGVALISQFGFEKYKEWGGWKKVPDAYNRYDDAHGRHDNALQRGETHCPESHKLHLAHRAWNALATYELYLIEQERKDQSWATAANNDTGWKAEQFEKLKAANPAFIVTPAAMLPIIDDAGGDAPVEPFKLLKPSEIEKILYAPKERPVEQAKKFTTCGKCDDINECGGAGRCFGR